MELRSAAPQDLAQIRRLWALGFPGDEATLDCLLQSAFYPRDIRLLCHNGDLCGMLFLLPARMLAGRERRRAVYIYGFTTHPAVRGQGYGRAMLHTVTQQARLENTLVFLRPGTQTLWRYYEQAGFQAAFSMVESRGSFSGAPAPLPALRLTSACAADYAAARRDWMADRAYIEWDAAALVFANVLASEAGGGLYVFEDGGKTGCAIVEIHGTTVFCKELLCRPQTLPCVCAALKLRFPKAAGWYARQPAFFTHPPETLPQAFGMCYAHPPATDIYLGPAFD